MHIAADTLNGLDDLYSQLLELTPHANELLAAPYLADGSRREYQADGFVKLPGILPPDALSGLVIALLPILSTISEEVIMRHQPGADHTLSDGARFWRVDPHCVLHPDSRQKLTRLLGGLGLVELGSLLASRLTPLIRHIAGQVSFRRVYFYVYKEGDYISVHDDHHVGARVDVQFPVTFGAAGGLRVLHDGFLRMQYDSAGDMNVLGPNVWHDVPPLLRGTNETSPQRFNMGFRFTPDDA